MAEFDFAYALAADGAGLPLAISVFSDRAAVRQDMAEDVELAGLAVRECGPLQPLADADPRVLGEAVLVDCPVVDGATMAALARLDGRAARSGAQLVISTSIDALDDVFGCCSQSRAEILVNPRRADRMIALGRIMARLPHARVRELAEADRITLLRLSEQVSRIAERLEQMDGDGADGGGDGAVRSPAHAFRFADGEGGAVRSPGDRLVRSTRPPLPDARLVRRIIAQRQLRARFFDGELFADPAWDMLLDLTAARVEHVRVSVTSLCIASAVPPTTALRWISQLIEAGLFERVEDETDRRRAFIQLTDRAVDAMSRYFHELGKGAAKLV